MKIKNALTVAVAFALGTIALFSGCTKNDNPKPPIHDTVTVTKHDTTQLTDTLYTTKPDPTVNLNKGLLLYLPFSGNFADSSGNGNPTTAINGASLTYDEHGWANNAFGSNGTGSQVILVTNNGSIQFDTAYSISMDFMTNDASTLHTYLSMVDYYTGEGPSFALGQCTPGYQSFFDIGVNDSSVDCSSYGLGNPHNLNDTTTFKPVLGAWYNVVVIYNRGSVQFYVNGSLYHSKTGIPTIARPCPASQIVVGGWWNGGPETINGKLDEIRLYNRVLTPHEITWLARNFQVTSTRVKPALKTAIH